MADQQQPEVATRRQPRSADFISIESQAESFDVPVEIMAVENLIQCRVERMRGRPGRSSVATHIDACVACRRRIPIAIADNVVRRIDSVDLHKPHDARQLIGVSKPASEA